MNIIIAGDGKVGATLTRELSSEGHNLTLIDLDSKVLEGTVERYDVMAVQGNCAAMSTLLQAGVKDADLLIAATNADEVNLLCCMTAHGLNHKLHTIARIRNPEYNEQMYEMRDLFALSLTVNPERQAAMEIERLLKFPGFLKRDSFANGRAEIVELRVDESSKLCNVSLSEMYGIIKCRVLVCAVLRDGEAVTPRGDFVLHAGDRIFVTAPTSDLAVLLKNLGIISRRVRSCILCGGGRVGYYLASLLEKDRISVKIIEQDEARCRELAEALTETVIVQGDCSNQSELEDEGIADCDAFIALSGFDEMNAIVSLYAAKRGVPQVITKLSRGVDSTISNTLPLGSVICPKELCCNTIVRYVRAMQNQTGAAVSVHSIADGHAEAVEFLLDASAKNCGKPLKELKLKPNVLMVSISHGSRTWIPGGDSQFHAGDTVVVVTNAQTVLNQFNDIFA